MAKIDLCDPKWVDMVFADKNKEYGAYKLRKTVSQRNIKALAILLCAAFLGGGYLAYQIKKHNDELAAQAEYAAKMELAALEQAKKEQAERKKQQKKEEPKKIEPEKVVPETRATVKFTAPVIKDDKDVKVRKIVLKLLLVALWLLLNRLYQRSRSLLLRLQNQSQSRRLRTRSSQWQRLCLHSLM